MASMTGPDFLRRAEAAAEDLLRLSPAYAATPLIDLSSLAARLGVGQLPHSLTNTRLPPRAACDNEAATRP